MLTMFMILFQMDQILTLIILMAAFLTAFYKARPFIRISLCTEANLFNPSKSLLFDSIFRCLDFINVIFQLIFYYIFPA